MRLWCVRHGESVWNVERRVQGQAPGVHLTALGRAQAEDAAARLASLAAGASRLVSSDLERAVETAAPIAARLGLRVETEPALREQALGELEGRRASELRAEPVPEGRHINEIRWGGGESIADVYARLATWVEAARAAGPGEASWIVVSHEGTLQVLRTLVGGGGWRDVDWTPLRHGEIVDLDLDVGDHPDPSNTRGAGDARPSTGD